jgi:hypothetical protein
MSGRPERTRVTLYRDELTMGIVAMIFSFMVMFLMGMVWQQEVVGPPQAPACEGIDRLPEQLPPFKMEPTTTITARP